MVRNQWLRIIPFFLCIFSLMSLFLPFGTVVVRAPEIAELNGLTREFNGWQASLTTVYAWLMIALPVVILLAKLMPEARHLEPAAALLLPGIHIVLMFLTFRNLRNVGAGFPGGLLAEAAEIRTHVGIGFLLMLACQLALIVFRLIELTSHTPAKPNAGAGDMVPVQQGIPPERRR